MKVNLQNIGANEVISVANNKELFAIYINDIAKYKPFSREEERELFEELQLDKTNQRIIDKIVKHNLLFVYSVAKQYKNAIRSSSLTLEDLVNEGNLGLHAAITKFDPETGNKFISYAVWWIKSSILTAIQRHVKTIRVANNANIQVSKFTKEARKLEKELERKPATIEVFESLQAQGLTTKQESVELFDELLKISTFESSLNTFAAQDSTTELADLIEDEDLLPDEMLIKEQRKEVISKMLDRIPPRTKEYFIDHFGLNDLKPMSIADLSKKHGTSAQNITNQMRNAYRKLRYSSSNTCKFLYS